MSQPLLTAIVALDEHMLIGRDGDLPWRLPADLKRFKARTMGKPILMGRTTYESIGRPLPGRQNIVLTRQPDLVIEGCDVVKSLDQALDAAGSAEEIMVIGGEQIYALCMPRLDRLAVTLVHGVFDGDTWFPALELGEWEIIDRNRFEADERNPHAQTDLLLSRRPSPNAVSAPAEPRSRTFAEWVKKSDLVTS